MLWVVYYFAVVLKPVSFSHGRFTGFLEKDVRAVHLRHSP